jgi:hypothetical protein
MSEGRLRTETTVSKCSSMQVFDVGLTKVKDQRVLGVGVVIFRYLGERSVIIKR